MDDSRLRDRWFSPLIGLLGGLVYVATLAPGLITGLYATFDTDKYHAIVPALGIPHHPGYPIYMMLGWLFTLVPIGTLAGRVNLLSAVAGGVAIALACALMRRLGVRRVIAGAVALSFGFGLVFWKNAVVAEVYTLASVLLFAVFLALARWHDDRRPRDFYLAVGCTGLIASHHTAELLMVPVLVAFVLSIDARWALRPGVLFRSASIALAALLPYAWVVYRTIDGTSFVEAPARTPWDVVQLITATQFTERLEAAGAVNRALTHSPLFWSAFQEELGLATLVAAAAGLASLVVSRRWRIAMLLAGSGVFFLCFAAIYQAVDILVFLLPVFAPLWVLSAVGFERIARGVQGWLAGRGVRPATAGLAALAVIAVPVSQLAANYVRNDLSRATFYEEFFTSFLDSAPVHSGVIDEARAFMLHYELGPNHRRGSARVSLLTGSTGLLDERAEADLPTFAFAEPTFDARMEGFFFSPVNLQGPPIARAIDQAPYGTVVVVALSAALAGRLRSEAEDLFGAIGGALGAGAPDRCRLIVGVAGRTDPIAREGNPAAAIDLVEGTTIGDTRTPTPHAIHASCDGDAVTIRIGNRNPVRSVRGGAYAIAGRTEATPLTQGRIADDRRGSTGLDMWRLPLFQMTAGRQCQPLPAGSWFDGSEPGRDGGVLVIVGAADEVILYAAGGRPLAPRWPHVSRNGWQDIVATAIPDAAAVASLPELERETAAGLLAAYPHVARVRARVRLDAGDRAGVQVLFGGVPSRVVAHATAGASLCRTTVGEDRLYARPNEAAEQWLEVADDSDRRGAGWGAAESLPSGRAQQLAESSASLLVPLAAPGDLEWHARLRGSESDQQVDLEVNGVRLGPRVLSADWSTISWHIPEAALRGGTNEISFVVDGFGPGQKPPAVQFVRIVRLVGPR